MDNSKDKVRQRVWKLLQKERVARFPFPIEGRIPNFVGSEKAAALLAREEIFREAKTVKVNPDSPQLKVRELALRSGKTLLMPSPRLRAGFVMVQPGHAKGRERYAASIAGAARTGKLVSLRRMPPPDLLVVGSVAVSSDGSRLGKGEGYSEIEYAVLRELGKIGEDIPIYTTVHELQIVDHFPQEEYDVSVDYIVTQDRLFSTHRSRKRPNGVLWDLVDDEMMKGMPVLAELSRDRRKS